MSKATVAMLLCSKAWRPEVATDGFRDAIWVFRPFWGLAEAPLTRGTASPAPLRHNLAVPRQCSRLVGGDRSGNCLTVASKQYAE